MILSEQYAIKLRDSIRNKPLGPGESRRLEGLGEAYVSQSEPAQEGYRFHLLFAIQIDGQNYGVYNRFRAEETKIS